MRGLTHPDQEFMYCYKGNHKFLDQYSRLPDCRGLQMNPTCRIGKNSIGKVCSKLSLFPYFLYCSFQFCEKLNKKAKIKDGHLYSNHCWHKLGLGMIAKNDPNITMSEKMAYSCHSNPSSDIAYIRAGHNSDFAFQKAISGAPKWQKGKNKAPESCLGAQESNKTQGHGLSQGHTSKTACLHHASTSKKLCFLSGHLLRAVEMK
jgi:hypothetical protein